ncbi:FliH/SctL family protein [Hephaestia sp. GCM10023244]|uniref:FliH/SctL family protein n=1 Tax=unclassified Hephaestia TaxID=2631281 RepID=UPI0020779423|nr:FliH/SctL family protein [Hephaestia sp. MAHUQ-44]MCM8731262.1 FliH/SctL family protein [Hephaestia sp. MAHUQ-44]
MSDARRADAQPEFTAGFASRHELAAHILAQAFAPRTRDFAPSDIKQRAGGKARPKGPVGFAPQGKTEATPRHFAPADPDTNPTEGWDPFDPDATQQESTGFLDPVAAAQAAGYAEGLAAARAEAAEAALRDRGLVEGIAAALNAGDRYDRERMAAQLRQTVLLLVRRIVGETEIDATLLAARIEAAIDMLADAAEAALLRVNPADVALLDGKLPGTIFAAGDAEVKRGSFVLESASTIVEEGPDLWLEQLVQAIDQVAVPPLC